MRHNFINSSQAISVHFCFLSGKNAYYDKTTELISAGRESVRDLLDYYVRYEPRDIAFNVVASKKYLYILYG